MVTVTNASTNADLSACWPQSNQQVLRRLHCQVYRSFVANEGNDDQQPNEVKVMAMRRKDDVQLLVQNTKRLFQQYHYKIWLASVEPI